MRKWARLKSSLSEGGELKREREGGGGVDYYSQLIAFDAVSRYV